MFIYNYYDYTSSSYKNSPFSFNPTTKRYSSSKFIAAEFLGDNFEKLSFRGFDIKYKLSSENFGEEIPNVAISSCCKGISRFHTFKSFLFSVSLNNPHNSFLAIFEKSSVV